MLHLHLLGNPARMESNRRTAERRACDEHLGERGMRCEHCGRVSYSAVAELVVERFSCLSCGGALHRERRSGPPAPAVA